MKRFLILLAIIFFQTICLCESKAWGENGNLEARKKNLEIQKIVKLKIDIPTEKEENILKSMNLVCEWNDNSENSGLDIREVRRSEMSPSGDFRTKIVLLILSIRRRR